jgi:hypothetical protein
LGKQSSLFCTNVSDEEKGLMTYLVHPKGRKKEGKKERKKERKRKSLFFYFFLFSLSRPN